MPDQPSDSHQTADRTSYLMGGRYDRGHAVFDYTMGEVEAFPCKWSVGDLVYCKETFTRIANGGDILYRANTEYDGMVTGDFAWHWTPSIFMRKADARLWFEITEIRCQRVKDISEGDAIAEGIERWDDSYRIANYRDYSFGPSAHPHHFSQTPISSFFTLWESIHGDESWDRDWVFALTLKRIEKPCL